MRSRISVAILVAAAWLASPRAADASIWDWMQEWSGPGPFSTQGGNPSAMIDICKPGYESARAMDKDAQCIFIDLRNLVANNSNFPVRVTATMVDVGISRKLPVGPFQNSLEYGAGVGWLHVSAGTTTLVDGRTIGGRSFDKRTITVPRLMAKPLLAAIELSGKTSISKAASRRTRITRKLLSVPKVHAGGTIITGHLESEQFGVPRDVHDFSANWEYRLTTGVLFDLSELWR